MNRESTLGKWLLLCLLALVAVPATAQQASAQDDEAAPGSDEVAEAFGRMDSDRDGQLSIEEFRAGIVRPFGSDRPGVVYQKLPARFRALDADGSEYLEAGEFAVLLQRWHGPGPEPTLAAADQGGDGRIDFREFAAMHAPRDAAPAPDTAPAEDSATR